MGRASLHFPKGHGAYKHAKDNHIPSVGCAMVTVGGHQMRAMALPLPAGAQKLLCSLLPPMQREGEAVI